MPGDSKPEARVALGGEVLRPAMHGPGSQANPPVLVALTSPPCLFSKAKAM
jgi:hypothetical protein